jgi:hypothetical protein
VHPRGRKKGKKTVIKDEVQRKRKETNSSSDSEVVMLLSCRKKRVVNCLYCWAAKFHIM